MLDVVERVVTGDGVVLRIWQPGDHDRAALVTILERSRAAFGDWLPGVMSDLADLDAFLGHVDAAFVDGTGFFYAIDERGEPVGQVSLSDRGGGTSEIGYWVRSDCTGRGLATRAVRAVADAAFADGVRKLVIHCDAGNVRSARVATKAGFVHEGTHQLPDHRPGTPAQTGREMTWVLLAGGVAGK